MCLYRSSKLMSIIFIYFFAILLLEIENVQEIGEIGRHLVRLIKDHCKVQERNRSMELVSKVESTMTIVDIFSLYLHKVQGRTKDKRETYLVSHAEADLTSTLSFPPDINDNDLNKLLMFLTMVSIVLYSQNLLNLEIPACGETGGYSVYSQKNSLFKQLVFSNLNTSLSNLKARVYNTDIRKIRAPVFKDTGRFNDAFKHHPFPEWLFSFDGNVRSTVVNLYPLQSFFRLASFRPLSTTPSSSPGLYCKLSSAGFRYTRDSIVVCESCNKREDIKNFNSDPSCPEYHEPGCSYVASATAGPKPTPTRSDGECRDLYVVENDGHNGGSEDIEADGEISCMSSPRVSNIQTTNKEQTRNPVEHFPKNDLDNVNENVSHLGEVDAGFDELLSLGSSLSAEASLSSTIHNESFSDDDESSTSDYWSLTSEETEALTVSRLRDGPPNDWIEPDRNTVESEFFVPERVGELYELNFVLESAKPTCQKSPNHLGFVRMRHLTLEALPKKIRYREVLNLIRHSSRLVVKLIVSVTSKARMTDPSSLDAGLRRRVGTGSLFEKKCFVDALDETATETRKSGKIFIETHRNLIYNDEEARGCTAYFTFDSDANLGPKKLKGVRIEHSPVLGDDRSFLVCTTEDLAFFDLLIRWQQEFDRQAERLPREIQSCLVGRVIIVSYPHGGEQMVSFGKSTRMSYAIASVERDGKMSHNLTEMRYNNQAGSDHRLFRHVLMYTADTCPGCSGAPVITFKKSSDHYAHEFWMHHGISAQDDFNVSVMKAFTGEQIQTCRQLVLPKRSTLASPFVNQAINSATPSCSTSHSNSLPFRLTTAAYPVYGAFQKRLESYGNWPASHIFKDADLATAGFFYAGYADCVRCFHCGLGLRSWKMGDDIFTEHSRHRPTCEFLKAQIHSRASASPTQDFANEMLTNNARRPVTDSPKTLTMMVTTEQTPTLPRHSPNTPSNEYDRGHEAEERIAGLTESLQNVDSTSRDLKDSLENQKENLAERLLQRENNVLKGQLMCKACHVKPIKDLFLPCGELYACEECSEKFSNCPSCNKLILGTVKVYFT
ncbi:unnamed protein product [Lymnaea stagnalis]|uniref:RING-type domain-containing protein n=1 Tax=Lymnaea stagnalis TaxID=6523 RepID=A0AAV2HK56_LYMST